MYQHKRTNNTVVRAHKLTDRTRVPNIYALYFERKETEGKTLEQDNATR